MTRHQYTDNQKTFLTANAKGKTSKELSELFYDEFEIRLSEQQLKSFKKVHNCPSGIVTHFKKGIRPHNTLPVGTEIINNQGYISVKIGEPNRWEFKHKIVYESAFGKVRKGCQIVFLDRNKLNVSIENLVMVRRGEFAYTGRHHLLSDNPEITRAGLMIAKIVLKANELERVAT